MAVTIEELQLAALAPADLAGSVALLRESDQERFPEDPTKPDDVYVRLITAAPPDGRLFFWAARGSGAIVGGAYLQLPDRENLQMGWTGVIVSPAARRHGIGRRLLRTVAERASADGRRAL